MTTDTSFIDELRRARSGIPIGFDPEADVPELVRPLRKAGRELLVTITGAQRVGALGVQQATAAKDLTDDAKARIRAEQIERARSAIATSAQEYSSSWASFLEAASEAAEASLRPKSLVPHWPSGVLSEDTRAALEHQRAQVRASEDVARRLAEDRADRMLDRALAADPDAAGGAVLEAYAAVRDAGDAVLLDAFERVALARSASPAQRQVLELAIQDGRVARLPEPIQRLAVYAELFAPLDVWREAMLGEAGDDAFWAKDGGGGALKPADFAKVAGPELAAFLGAEELA